MLNIKLTHSELSPHLSWQVNWSVQPGLANWLQGANGVGKTSLFEEIKIQWHRPSLQLGFVDQEPLVPFQDLTVAQVFDLLWDIGANRRVTAQWQQLKYWDEESRSLWPRKVALLSGGENQWIKVLMMLSLKSDIWLLDEPFQSLDQRRRETLLRLLASWLEEGKYLILSHHGSELSLPAKTWHLEHQPTGTYVREGGQ